MKTIMDYLNNMFASLPKTKQLQALKDELLANMEDKYNELKQEGKSENEAIGIVISEFGNIDELLKELEIPFVEEEKSAYPEMTEDEVHAFLADHHRASKLIGLGVFLCILAPAMLLLMTQLAADGLLFGIAEELGTILGLIPLLILIAIAVGLFINSDMIMKKYKKVEETGKFHLTSNVKRSLEAKHLAFQPTFMKSIILGVALCILSPISLFITIAINEDGAVYGVVLLLLIISIAVNLFIYYGRIKEGYKKLLKMEEYSDRSRKENKVVGAVAAIVFPLAVCIFLISGLMFHQWHINWIVFPITALLFGMFSGAYSILKEKN